jgi:hypothetical protein
MQGINRGHTRGVMQHGIGRTGRSTTQDGIVCTMRRISRHIALLAAALLLAACAIGPAYQPPPPPADGYATIVIYREERWRSGAWPSKWYVDEQPAISIYGNGYATFQLRAGQHQLHSAETVAASGLKINARFSAGRTYFFKLDTVVGNGYVTSSIKQIDNEAANAELKTYRMSEPVRARIE